MDAADFERVVLEHAARMREQGIAYAEISFNPQLHHGIAWIDGVVSGRRRAREQFGVEIEWLVELAREASIEANRAALDLALSVEGVVGLGLVGDERVAAAPLAPLFASARERGLGLMPHAGQTGGPSSIREALEALGAGRIAHGITAAADPQLLADLAGGGVCLCVAPSSNAKAGLRPDLARLAEAGVALCAGTDDPALVGTTLGDELDGLAAATGRSRDELQAAAWAARFRG